MKIMSLLTPENVITGLTAASREEAVRKLAAALGQVRSVDVDGAVKAVAARERSGATLLSLPSCVVGIPHASTDACKQLMMAVGTCPEGVPWDATRTQVHLIFLLLGPPQTRALHLRILSRVAKLCQNPHFAPSLLASSSPDEVLAAFAAAEEPLSDIVGAEGMPSFAVLGAGHGGMAMAGHLALTGCRVNLYNRHRQRLLAVEARNGIEVLGAVTGFASLNCVTTDPAEALANVDVVMVVVPAIAHRDVAESIAPHVSDGQIVVLNPGRTGGSLQVAKVLRDRNPSVRPYIAEAQSLLYTSRVTNPGQVRIFAIKNSIPLATLPAYEIADVLPVIRTVLPQFVPGDNVLKTSLDNIGAVFHPAITILNAGRIEDTHGDFDYYVEGVTPSVAQVLEAVDRERVEVASALGIRANTAREWLYLAYDAAGKTLLEAMQANPGYRDVKAPRTIQHRYISEDVPTSLVPIASLGEMLGVPTPSIRAMIHLASLMHGVDYWAEGRTVQCLGIEGMSVKDLRFLVVGAEVPAASVGDEPSVAARSADPPASRPSDKNGCRRA
ncbi:MAG TPA: NAD/NADP octopine/nopaline dehydrogenase family protein [Candidatus Anammoximicrobium sp.]|nr:NAD/NADP octopine/nopaline dehydrogenase family protein [Candidatus Anammoximicrobium sp.]